MLYRRLILSFVLHYYNTSADWLEYKYVMHNEDTRVRIVMLGTKHSLLHALGMNE